MFGLVIWSSPSRGCAGGREGGRMGRLHGWNCFIALESRRNRFLKKYARPPACEGGGGDGGRLVKEPRQP